MIAQINPTPTQLLTWLGCAAFFCTAILQGWKLVEKLRGKKPQPPNEVLAGLTKTLKEAVNDSLHRMEKMEEANKREHALFDQRLDGIYRKQREYTEQKVDALRKETDASLVALHERTNEILHAVGRIEGKMELLNYQTKKP